MSKFKNNNVMKYILENTDWIADINKQSVMIIFESLLTPFEASCIFDTPAATARIILSLKPNPHNQV